MKSRKKMCLCLNYRTSGFTLIELLIVLAVISILAGMLLPVLGKAKEMAHATSCTNNLKQHGLIFNFYQNDYDGWMVPYYHFTVLKPWYNVWTLDCGYLPAGSEGQYKDMKKHKWLGCPSAPIPDSSNETSHDRYGFQSSLSNRYTANGSFQYISGSGVFVSDFWKVERYMNIHRQYSKSSYELLTSVIADSVIWKNHRQHYEFSSSSDGMNSGGVHFRHNGAANFLMMDSSVVRRNYSVWLKWWGNGSIRQR